MLCPSSLRFPGSCILQLFFVLAFPAIQRNGFLYCCGEPTSMRKRVQKTPVYGPSENHTSIETIPTQQTLTSGYFYVNGPAGLGFGNMWFVFKMSEPVPAMPVWTIKSNGGLRPEVPLVVFRTVLQDWKKCNGIFWLFQDFITLRFLNEI